MKQVEGTMAMMMMVFLGKDANVQFVNKNNVDEVLGVAKAEPIDKQFYKPENFIGGKILRVVEC